MTLAEIIERIGIEPYYQDDAGVIFNADCLDVMKQMPEKCVDLVVTDPPYGINYNTDYRRFTGGYREGNNFPKIIGDEKPFEPSVLSQFKNQIIWGANCFSDKLTIGTWLIWDKRFQNGEAFLSDAEVAWMNKGFGVYIFSLTSQGFNCPDGKRVHPTQKPIALMRWCIEKYKDSNIIFDPYCGSGSTLIAAKELGRKYIGIEISEAYCKIAVQRLAQEILI